MGFCSESERLGPRGSASRVDFREPLPLPGAKGRRRTVGTARANVRASRLSVDDQRRQIIVSVVNALIAEADAERVSEINRIGLADSLARRSIVETKQALGAGNALDLQVSGRFGAQGFEARSNRGAPLRVSVRGSSDAVESRSVSPVVSAIPSLLPSRPSR